MHDSAANYSVPPRERSQLRLGMGRVYYTGRRYWDWVFSSKQYARNIKTDSLLPYTVMSHQTPLLRQLRQVDMQLQYNKITNLQLACPCINGLVLQPGETFSFWKLVGKPTRRKGYLDGMVLCNGGFYSGTGGGLCQLSNLIYWMTLHTPLTVTERWRHNYDVFPDNHRTQPFGSGATIAYNYIDLQIINDTCSAYQLMVGLDEQFLRGEWLSSQPGTERYEVYEREHIIKAEWWGGHTRHNVLGRRVYDVNGQEIGDEFICANQAIMMYQPMLP
jgi:vancomycin resistance protein VanW